MITNPETLFISDEEKNAFIEIIKDQILNEIELSVKEDLF